MVDRVPYKLALATGFVAIAGLALGLAVDLVLGTRPIATLVLSVAAAQAAAFMVYRRFADALRAIGDQNKPEEQA